MYGMTISPRSSRATTNQPASLQRWPVTVNVLSLNTTSVSAGAPERSQYGGATGLRAMSSSRSASRFVASSSWAFRWNGSWVTLRAWAIFSRAVLMASSHVASTVSRLLRSCVSRLCHDGLAVTCTSPGNFSTSDGSSAHL